MQLHSLVTPEDYVMNSSRLLTIQRCQKKACTEIFVEDDHLVEETESFNITLYRTFLLYSSVITQHRLQGVIHILDNDGTYTFQKQLVSSSSAVEHNLVVTYVRQPPSI